MGPLFSTLSWTTLLLGAIAALLAGFAKTGMPGAGIPAVALMAEAFRENTKLSVGAILPVLIVGDIFAIIFYRRHAQWKKLTRLVPYVLAGMVPGYWVLWQIEDNARDNMILRVLLGVVILVLLGFYVARRYFGWEEVPHTWWFTAGTGSLAGFGTVIGNAAGPIMSVYLISQGMDKHKFLGTAAWFFFLVNVSKIPLFAYLGMITPTTLTYDAIWIPIVIVGACSGAWVVKHIPQKWFDALVLGLSGVAAVRMILAVVE